MPLDDIQFEELLSILDADGSGEISYFEFAEMLAATKKSSRKTKRTSRPRPVQTGNSETKRPITESPIVSITYTAVYSLLCAKRSMFGGD